MHVPHLQGQPQQSASSPLPPVSPVAARLMCPSLLPRRPCPCVSRRAQHRLFSSSSSDDGRPNGSNCPRATRWNLISRRVSTADHLRQLLCRAVLAGLLSRPTSLYDGGGWNPCLRVLNSVIQTLVGGRVPEHAASFYAVVRRAGVSPDDYSFTFVLKAAARLRLPRGGEQLHCQSLKLGFGSNVFVQNSLIHMYFACGLPGTACQLFDTLPYWIHDVVTWNSMISGNVQSGLCEEALRVYVKMGRGLASPDSTTLTNALVACGRIGAVILGGGIHAVVIFRGFHLDFFLGSSMIDMYAKCEHVGLAQRVFDEMPERNAVCWTSMISGYAHVGEFQTSLDLFRDMQIVGVKPDEATIASVVSACGQLGALDQGRWVHAYCDTTSIFVSLKVKNALIDMYSKCGDMKRALQIFHGLEKQDVFSWSAMISGLAMNGYSYKALDLFSRMVCLGRAVPNDITFLGVLSACSHAGLVEKGFYYFKSMTNVYKLIPRIQHYGCMVDLLGRARRIVEAISFIRRMPIQPDLVIWRSLLFASRNCGNIELAELAIKFIIELEPNKHGAHVLLSNVYASASKWKEVDRVRSNMSYSGVYKQPGCSFIEVDGSVHEFFVAGTSQIHILHQILLGLNQLLLSEGHACPETGMNEL